MRILHITPYYPPDRVGGVGEHVRIIHEGHLALNVDSAVLTSGSTRSDSRVRRVGRTPVGFAMNSWRGLRLAKARDIVHAHHGEGLLLLLLLRLRRRRPRILTMFHVDIRQREQANRSHVFEGRRYGSSGLTSILRRFTGLIKAMVDWCAWLLADSVVVETQAVCSELSDLTPRRDVHVVAHGLGKAPQPKKPEPDHVELLFVGTPGIRKRTHLLPKILYRVRESLPDAHLRIVGFDVNGDPSLRSEAERLGVLSAIDFAGSVGSEDVVPFYRAADVLVLPSAYEGLPMVLLEAMRERLVPVATAVSGHPEAIDDGVSGYLVPLDDVNAMADRCVRLLQEPEALAAMGERARQTLTQRFSVDRELEAYADLYRQLTARMSH